MDVSTEQKILIEQRVANDAKSLAVAYLLWLFLACLGAHRFYLGRVGTGVFMLLLFVGGWLLWPLGLVPLAIVAIWALVDAFLIPGIVAADKDRIRNDMMQMAAMAQAAARSSN